MSNNITTSVTIEQAFEIINRKLAEVYYYKKDMDAPHQLTAIVKDADGNYWLENGESFQYTTMPVIILTSSLSKDDLDNLSKLDYIELTDATPLMRHRKMLRGKVNPLIIDKDGDVIDDKRWGFFYDQDGLNLKQMMGSIILQSVSILKTEYDEYNRIVTEHDAAARLEAAKEYLRVTQTKLVQGDIVRNRRSGNVGVVIYCVDTKKPFGAIYNDFKVCYGIDAINTTSGDDLVKVGDIESEEIK